MPTSVVARLRRQAVDRGVVARPDSLGHAYVPLTLAATHGDTRIIASSPETILVLSGVTRRKAVARYSYQPHHVVTSIDEIDV